MEQFVLKTSALTKQYNQQTSLNQVELSIRRGDIYALVGQNGAGKTTLMRIIAGHSYEDSGEICLLGEVSQDGLLKARKKIGTVIEMPAFYPNLTAEQNLEYYRIQKGIADKECVFKVLEMVNLANTEKKKFKNFSLGMKQRLGLALSLLGNPDFLILDEPINGLDPTGVIEIREILKRLNGEGITILISSHILSELYQISTRYGFIHKGNFIKEIDNKELDESCRQAIYIEVNDVNMAITILEKELGISDYKAISSSEIYVYDFTYSTSEIAKQLVLHDVSLITLKKMGESLEDYYAALIKEVE